MKHFADSFVTTGEANNTEQTMKTISMPHYLKEMIARRVAAQSQYRDAVIGQPGQIVFVDVAVFDEGAEPAPGIMSAPIFVLLDAPDEDNPQFWYGWIVARESQYASAWDHVFQDEDGTIDPEAAMVQVWNPVWLHLPMASRIVGQIAGDRLDAIRSLAADFLTNDATDDLPVAVGKIATRETSTGHWVVTGSRLSGQNDPRHRYQQSYPNAADVIRQAAIAAATQ